MLSPKDWAPALPLGPPGSPARKPHPKTEPPTPLHSWPTAPATPGGDV